MAKRKSGKGKASAEAEEGLSYTISDDAHSELKKVKLTVNEQTRKSGRTRRTSYLVTGTYFGADDVPLGYKRRQFRRGDPPEDDGDTELKGLFVADFAAQKEERNENGIEDSGRDDDGHGGGKMLASIACYT